jgi:hypothetical protein
MDVTEGGPHADGRQQDAGDRRADHAGDVHRRGLQRDGAAERCRWHRVDRQRTVGGAHQRHGGADAEGEPEQQRQRGPDEEHPGHQHAGQRGGRELPADDQPSAVERSASAPPIGDSTSSGMRLQKYSAPSRKGSLSVRRAVCHCSPTVDSQHRTRSA